METQSGLVWVPDRFDTLTPTWTKETDLAVIANIAQKHFPSLGPFNINFHASGAFNKFYRIEIKESQAVIALMRVSLPVCPGNKTRSEVATMKWLRRNTETPVPEIYAYSDGTGVGEGVEKNELEFEWILMEMMAGEPLEKKWRSMDEESKFRIVGKIAEYSVQLFRHQFEGIGSIYDEEDGKIGEIVARDFFWGARIGMKVPRGPFKSAREWYESRLRLLQQEQGDLLKKYKKESLKEDNTAAVEESLKELEIVPGNELAVLEDIGERQKSAQTQTIVTESTEIRNTSKDNEDASDVKNLDDLDDSTFSILEIVPGSEPTVPGDLEESQKLAQTTSTITESIERVETAEKREDSNDNEDSDDDDDSSNSSSSDSYSDIEETLELVSRLSTLLPSIFDTNPETTCLRHTDLNATNILISPTNTITAILDWESCPALPLYLSCQPPRFLEGRERLVRPDRAEYGPDEDADDPSVPPEQIAANEGLSMLYWEHLIEYEQTILRKHFREVARTMAGDEGWVEDTGEAKRKADFDRAVHLCGWAFCGGSVERWIDEVEGFEAGETGEEEVLGLREEIFAPNE